MTVDVQAGLREGSGGAEDVNSVGGFTAALAEMGLPPIEPGRTEVSRSIADGLSIGSPKVEEPAEEPTTPVADEGAAQEEETPDPPAYADLLEKHDGDAEKALADLFAQHESAQSQIGKQSNDVGQLREALAKLEGRLDQATKEQAAPAAQPVPFVSKDQIESAVLESDGRSVINQLAASGFPDGHEAYEHAWRAWIAEDTTGEALQSYTNYKVNLANPSTKATATDDPRLEKLAQKDAEAEFTANVNADVATVKAGFRPEEWEALSPHIDSIIESRKSLSRAVVSDDPEVRKDAIQAAAELALAHGLKEAADQERKKTNAASKQAAAVVTGSQRPSSGSPGSADGDEDRVARLAEFSRRMLSAPSTSVAAGLKFGQ